MNTSMRSILRQAAGILISAAATLSAFAEDGVTDKTIRIGQTVGVTGQIAAQVKEMIEGANAYISVVNKRGGVNGRKIEIITLDDKFDPAIAAKNAEKLIMEEQVFALFQCRGTPHTQAILPVLVAGQVPLVAPSTGAAIFHEPVNPLLFNVRARYQDEVAKGVQLFTTVGIRKISLIHVDDSFGKDGLGGFTKAMAAHDLKPVSIIQFDRVNPDFNAVVGEAIKGSPQAVIIVSSAPTAITIIRSLREKGSRMQVMTLSNNASQSFVQNLGPAGAGVIISQITPAPDLVSSVLGQEFKLAAAASNATVSYAAMEGFVAAKVLVKGLEQAGRKLTRAGFIRGLESIRKTDLGGITLSYAPDRHTGSEYVELTMIGKNGRYVR
ncbi:ABC transporter substrate-binding protein [soil metagenome]